MFPDSWRTVAIQDIAEVVRGASPRPKGDPRYYGGNVPRLMVADVTRDGKYVTPRIDSLTEEGAKLSRPMPAGTLTVVCSGVVGVPAILSVDSCIHDGFLALANVSNQCDIEFLYYTFLPLKDKLNAAATHGGVFTNLTTKILKEFQIPLPPHQEQKKIVQILSAWDRAIALTEQLIAAKQKRKWGLRQRLLKGTFIREDIDPDAVAMTQLYQVKPGDLIVNITFAWEGAIAIVQDRDEGCLVSHRFPTYEFNHERVVPDFFKYLMITKRFIYELGIISPGGAGRNRVLNKKDLLKIKVKLPPTLEEQL